MKSLLYELEIPSVLGFRWELNHKVAKIFAERFYTNFFEESKYIPKALQCTRSKIREIEQNYNEKNEDKIKNMWAAPVLIYQETI